MNGNLASRLLRWFDQWGGPQRPPTPAGRSAAKSARFGRAAGRDLAGRMPRGRRRR